MLLNGKNFEIFYLDNQTSVINRIASEFNTLPKYLYFTPDIITDENITTDIDIKVEDILAIIKDHSKDSFNFGELYEKVKDKINQQGLSLDNDIFIPYICFLSEDYSTNFELPSPEQASLSIEAEVKNDFKDKKLSDVSSYWNTYKSVNILETLRNIIEKNKQICKGQSKQYKEFNKEYSKKQKGLTYTEFELENANFNIIFDVDVNKISLMEIFNSIVLDNTVPVVFLDDYTKILKGFVPDKDWFLKLEDIITFKISVNKSTQIVENTEYISAYMAIENDKLIVQTTLDLSNDNISKDEFINRILNVIKLSMKVSDINYLHVKGIFYIPFTSINNHVFSDLVMNDSLFSTLMYIDESRAATKAKTSLYIYFNHPKTGNITANITDKISSKLDVNVRKKDKTIFPYNKHYIRILITKATNLNYVAEFQKIIYTLVKLYEKKYDDIVTIYREYINNFAENTEEVITEDSSKLEDVMPQVFKKGFKCSKKPVIISNEEAEIKISEGTDVMKFPIHKELGLEPSNYICPYDDKKMVGLKENTDSNKDIFPNIPCCFKADQHKKPVYVNYFTHDDQGSEVRNVSEHKNVITTNKIIDRDKFGNLPQKLDNLFNKFLKAPYEFKRKGVVHDPNNFIDCIVDAMNTSPINNETRRIKYLKKIRSEFTSSEYINICKQTMYNFTTNEIKNIIKSDQYLDPKYFIPLLENYFNCNIYLFERRTDDMITPSFIHGYYKNANTNKCIFIYENTGSKSDKIQYPQCEIISLTNTEVADDITYAFDYDDENTVKIRQIFDKMTDAYNLTKRIENVNFQLSGISQKVDFYGKCRAVNIEYKSKTVTIFTSPISPIHAPTDNNIYITDSTTAKQIIKDNKGKITKETSGDIHGIIGNVIVKIPIKEIEKSTLDYFIQTQKLAKCIVEYSIWLYSEYLNKEKLKNPTDESLLKFQKKYIKIIPDFKYGKVEEVFIENNKALMKDKKLIVSSEEALKRVLYVLRLFAARNLEKLLNYHKLKNLNNYYNNISDFTQYNTQVILKGTDSIDKWIENENAKHSLTNKVIPGEPKPYFFKNKLVNNKIYLAQNTDSIQNALELAITWAKKENDEVNTDNVSFNLYIYESRFKIEKKRVEKDHELNINIIGYKNNSGDAMFTVLYNL